MDNGQDRPKQPSPEPGPSGHHIALCYRNEDEAIVRTLAARLSELGLSTWAGSTSQEVSREVRESAFSDALTHSSHCVVILNQRRVSARQRRELSILLEQRAGSGVPRMILMLLPGSGGDPWLAPELNSAEPLDLREIQAQGGWADRLADVLCGAASAPLTEGATSTAGPGSGLTQPATEGVPQAAGSKPAEVVSTPAEGSTDPAGAAPANPPDRDAVDRQGPQRGLRFDLGRPEGSGERGVSRMAMWMSRLPRRVRMAAGGYLVVAAFAVGAGLAQIMHADRTTALVVGLLLASPLLAALIGDRITGVKAFSFEISLADVAVHVEGDFSGAVMAIAEMGPSGAPELLETLRSAITARSRILRLNLRDDDYWWSTRVFLVAALASDYTDVDAIVFVRHGDQRVFVGVATPTAVRIRMASRFPGYEVAYRKVRHELAQSPVQGPDQEVNEILTWRWAAALAPGVESQVKQTVTSRDLKEWLMDDLHDDDLPYGPLNPLLRYRIVTRPGRYAALTEASRLVAIVDRDELARRSTVADLEQRLA